MHRYARISPKEFVLQTENVEEEEEAEEERMLKENKHNKEKRFKECDRSSNTELF